MNVSEISNKSFVDRLILDGNLKNIYKGFPFYYVVNINHFDKWLEHQDSKYKEKVEWISEDD